MPPMELPQVNLRQLIEAESANKNQTGYKNQTGS